MEWFVIDADGLTRNYHSGGSALVLADSPEAAVAALGEQANSSDPLTVDEVRRLSEVTDKVLIFPDAGCC